MVTAPGHDRPPNGPCRLCSGWPPPTGPPSSPCRSPRLRPRRRSRLSRRSRRPSPKQNWGHRRPRRDSHRLEPHRRHQPSHPRPERLPPVHHQPRGPVYDLVNTTGVVASFGTPSRGSVTTALGAPVAGVALDPLTGGYWLAATNGAVFGFAAPPSAQPPASTRRPHRGRGRFPRRGVATGSSPATQASLPSAPPRSWDQRAGGRRAPPGWWGWPRGSRTTEPPGPVSPRGSVDVLGGVPHRGRGGSPAPPFPVARPASPAPSLSPAAVLSPFVLSPRSPGSAPGAAALGPFARVPPAFSTKLEWAVGAPLRTGLNDGLCCRR